MLESIEPSKFVSHKPKTSGEFDPKKESQPQVFVQLGFRKLRDSKLSGLCAFDDMTHWLSHKRCKKRKVSC